MAWLLLAVCAACKVLNIVCGLLSWRLYIRRLRTGDLQTRLEDTPPVAETENGQTRNTDGLVPDIIAEEHNGRASGISNQALEVETCNL